MFRVKATKGYRTSLKKFVRSGNFKIEELEKIVDVLVSGQKLSAKYKDHQLTGELKGFRECHIQPNVLLVYSIEKDELVLVLVNIGNYSNVFK